MTQLAASGAAADSVRLLEASEASGLGAASEAPSPGAAFLVRVRRLGLAGASTSTVGDAGVSSDMDCPFYGVRALKAFAQNDMDCGETAAAHLEAG